MTSPARRRRDSLGLRHRNDREAVTALTRIALNSYSTREQLREANLALADASDEVTLALEDALAPRTPNQLASWTQLVLTWGQNLEQRLLELSTDTVRAFVQGRPPSDIEVLAVFLAGRVVDGDGEDVTDVVRGPARVALGRRNTLTHHDSSASVLLAAHSFTNRTSLDLHALWEGKPAIDETARTLYHDVWPNPDAPTVIRPALLEFGERALTSGDTVRVARTSYPDGHPRAGEAFASLGARAPRPRGAALAMATEARHQPKPLHDEIGEILFELMQNTEWHAAQWAGGRTGANCRALSFREFSFDPAELNDADRFDPAFVAYARAAVTAAQQRMGGRVSRASFGSISVIDSGVGLARSVALSLGDEAPLSEGAEINYLIQALSKSIRVRRADMGNIGLPRVQQCLTNLRGYMSIRTGRVEIRRDFVNSPFEPLPPTARQAPPSLFLDWVPADPEEFVVGPLLGTAVTVVYPVEFEAFQ